MTANSKKARERFAAVADRPGMFVVDSYDAVAAFIAGIDYAHDGELLDGFEEWIQAKLGTPSPLVWSEYVKDRFEQMPAAERQGYGDDGKRFLLAHIRQFLSEKDAMAAAAE